MTMAYTTITLLDNISTQLAFNVSKQLKKITVWTTYILKTGIDYTMYTSLLLRVLYSLISMKIETLQ